jgi:hypothetical protein
MHVLVHELTAGKPAVPCKPAIQSGTPKYVLEIVSMCTYVPIKIAKNAVPNQGK